MAIVLSNLGINVDPVKMASKAIECGARVSGGTCLKRLSAAVSGEYGVHYKVTNDYNEVLSEIKRGSVVIANTGGNRNGHTGIFSSGGHYIVIIEKILDDVVIVDPGMYATKYSTAYRKKFVKPVGNFQFTTISTIDLDCSNRNPKYYIYTK